MLYPTYAVTVCSIYDAGKRMPKKVFFNAFTRSSNPFASLNVLVKIILCPTNSANFEFFMTEKYLGARRPLSKSWIIYPTVRINVLLYSIHYLCLLSNFHIDHYLSYYSYFACFICTC